MIEEEESIVRKITMNTIFKNSKAATEMIWDYIKMLRKRAITQMRVGKEKGPPQSEPR